MTTWLNLTLLEQQLDDDDFAKKVAKNCHDPSHDDRWCGTCSARADGIDDYREALIDSCTEEV